MTFSPRTFAVLIRGDKYEAKALNENKEIPRLYDYSLFREHDKDTFFGARRSSKRSLLMSQTRLQLCT